MTRPASDAGTLPVAAVAFESILEYLDPKTKAEQAWKFDAACVFEPKDLFFPDRGESAQSAKLVCSTCPVKVECLRSAIENREWDGIWGGTNEKERRPLIRHFDASTPAGCGCAECRDFGQRRREALGA